MLRLVIKCISVVLSVVIGFWLCYMLVQTRRAEQEKSRQIAAVVEQASPYELERRAIQSELSLIKPDDQTAVRTPVMVGFQVSHVIDLSIVSLYAQEYAFDPAVVISCDADQPLVNAVLRSGYDVVVNDETFEISRLASIREKTGSEYYLLKNTEAVEENYQALVDAGYKACFRFLYSADNEIMENGLVSLGYGYIYEDGRSVEEALSSMDESGNALLVVFDMQSYEDRTLRDSTIKENLRLVQQEIDDCNMEYYSVHDAVDGYQSRLDAKENAKRNQEEYIAQQRARMDELDKLIAEIYSQLKEE